jgi:hypothetical protein
VRQFFALANQHIRCELNDLPRRFDEQPSVSADRPIAQGSHDRFGELLSSQGVQVELDRGGGMFCSHNEL